MATLLDDPRTVPVVPGATYYFEAEQQVTTPATVGGTVLVPGTADWGPDNEAVQYNSYGEYLNGVAGQKAAFGKSDTPLRRSVLGAFLGEGLPGKGGAASVIVYRLAHADADFAEHTLQNTTPAAALVVSAKFKGTRGNQLALTVRASAVGGRKELVILDGAREAETYSHVQTDLAALAADINASSDYVTASVTTDGVALADVTGVALAGGDDGDDTVVAGDWTTMMSALEFEPFTVFAACDLVDTGIIASLRAWKDDLATEGKPIFLAIGGPTDEAFSDHKTRAQGYNDDHVLALGTGNVVDTALSGDGTAVTYSTAEWIARAAGAIARRGDMLDMVNVRFAGVTNVVGGATRAQVTTAATPGTGMTVIARDGDRTAPWKIPLGVTTYQDDNALKPRWVYSNVKFVRTNDLFEADLTEDQEHGDLIGELGVTERAADTVLGRAKDIVKDRVRRGIMQPGTDVIFDPEVPRSSTDDFVALAYDVVYVRGLRAIRNRIRLS